MEDIINNQQVEQENFRFSYQMTDSEYAELLDKQNQSSDQTIFDNTITKESSIMKRASDEIDLKDFNFEDQNLNINDMILSEQKVEDQYNLDIENAISNSNIQQMKDLENSNISSSESQKQQLNNNNSNQNSDNNSLQQRKYMKNIIIHQIIQSSIKQEQYQQKEGEEKEKEQKYRINYFEYMDKQAYKNNLAIQKHNDNNIRNKKKFNKNQKKRKQNCNNNRELEEPEIIACMCCTQTCRFCLCCAECLCD